MSRFLLVTFLIVLGVVAVSASEPKVIKDPAEYNVYVAALNTADRVQKAAAMESFIVKYPNSVVKLNALEQAMAAYQQVNNLAAVEKTAGASCR